MTRSILTFKGVSLVAVIFFVISSFDVLPTNGSNILGVFLSVGPSHLIVHMSIMKALAEKGHNVTVVSSLEPKITHKNIQSITIPPPAEQLEEYEKVIVAMSAEKASPIKSIFTVLSFAKILMDIQFNPLIDERFTALYENKDNKFDAVIMGYFLNDFQVAVGGKFNCPIIYSWMMQPVELLYNLVGIPNELSYVPAMHVPLKVGEIMDFPMRFKNFLFGIFFSLFSAALDHQVKGYYHIINAEYNKISLYEEKVNKMLHTFGRTAFYARLAANDSSLPTFEDMKKNISLLFCNSHYSEGFIRPLPPATVLIGGIQVKEKPDPLPKDIANLLNASKENGAILFSLGTQVKDDLIKPETIQAIFKVLSTLKQNVIWKWSDLANTPGNASNIVYKKWLPQDDILAHPNLKLFITHAGKGGVVEATYHGVPMVAVPIFGDQPANSQMMVVAGYGVEVDATGLIKSEFRNAVNEVLTNPSYATKVKTFSNIYRVRPLNAKESVVYWTEYVIRHRGARFMQSPMVHLNFVQRSNLDVIALIAAIFYIIYKLLQLMVRFIRRLAFATKGKKSKSE